MLNDAGRVRAASDNRGYNGCAAAANSRTRETGMLDPHAVLGQARTGTTPPTWRVFIKKRGRVKGFLRGTSDDPDPLLVISPLGVVEYADSKKPVTLIDFDTIARITLQVKGSSFSNTPTVHLEVWLDLHDHRGKKSKWQSASFADQHDTIQAVMEAYGAYRAFRAYGLQPG
jgi:hypothetical protein